MSGLLELPRSPGDEEGQLAPWAGASPASWGLVTRMVGVWPCYKNRRFGEHSPRRPPDPEWVGSGELVESENTSFTRMETRSRVSFSAVSPPVTWGCPSPCTPAASSPNCPLALSPGDSIGTQGHTAQPPPFPRGHYFRALRQFVGSCFVLGTQLPRMQFSVYRVVETKQPRE